MTEKTPSPTPNAPAFIIWFVPERDGAPWSRIGALWQTKSGKGYRMSLDLVTLAAGHLVVLPFEARANQPGGRRRVSAFFLSPSKHIVL
jgi:hypothetical protein